MLEKPTQPSPSQERPETSTTPDLSVPIQTVIEQFENVPKRRLIQAFVELGRDSRLQSFFNQLNDAEEDQQRTVADWIKTEKPLPIPIIIYVLKQLQRPSESLKELLEELEAMADHESSIASQEEATLSLLEVALRTPTATDALSTV